MLRVHCTRMCRGQRASPVKRVNGGGQSAAQAQAQADQLLGTQRIDLMGPAAPSPAAANPFPLPAPASAARLSANSNPNSNPNSISNPNAGAGSELAVVRGGSGVGQVDAGEEPSAPSLAEPLHNHTRRVGYASFYLDCEITGNPRPRYTWKKDGRPLSLSDAKYSMEDLPYGHRYATLRANLSLC